MTNCCNQGVLGSDPIIIKWNVVRGDTSTLNIDFFENDETTASDISDWAFAATAYDSKTNTFYSLIVDLTATGLTITAPSLITEQWGSDMSLKVAELQFDLEGLNLDETVWTPVIGTISVIGDVSGVGVLS